MSLKHLLRRARIVYHEHGLGEVIKRGKSLIERKARRSNYIPLETKTYVEGRVDNDIRWSVMAPYVVETESFADLGCAEGFFVEQAAEASSFSLGIDVDRERLEAAVQRRGLKSNMGFVNWNIDPETVVNLSEYDVISLLTVYHHLSRNHGYENGIYILKQIATKCDRLVFEPPGDRWIGLRRLTATATDLDTGEEYQLDYLGKSMYDEGWPTNRLSLGSKLSPGEYSVIVNSDEYGSSNPYEISITDTGYVLGGRPRVKIQEGDLTIVDGTDLSIDDMTQYYKRHLFNVLGDEIDILESETVNYKGGKRKDPFFVIDTSNVS